MVPLSLRFKLAGLAFRERILRFVWGQARVISLAVILLALACLTDWIWDRYQDTPPAIRVGLLLVQLLAMPILAFLFVLWPLCVRFTPSKLALMVEDRYPQLDHRLISAVELNRPGARTEGMSRELIHETTEQCLAATKHLNFARIADHRRLLWAAGVVLPLAGLACVALLLMSETLPILLLRQLQANLDIPRNVHLANRSKTVRPAGEEMQVVYAVSFRDNQPRTDLRGTVRIYPDGGNSRDVGLSFLQMDDADSEIALYAATVPASTVNIQFAGWLGDGRTKQRDAVEFVPRPVIDKQEAWMILPEYLGTWGKDKKNFEQPMPGGEIVGLPGRTVRVRSTFQKPVKEATLELTGPLYPDLSKPGGTSATQKNGMWLAAAAATAGLGDTPLFATAGPLLATRPDFVSTRVRALKQTFSTMVTEAEWTFDLQPTETGYRVAVLDQYDFENLNQGARSISIVPERPPQVALLREQFPEELKGTLIPENAEIFETDGIPVPLVPNSKILIGYTAAGQYGLGKAVLHYRVLRKIEGSQEEKENPPKALEDKWQTLPLIEKQQTDETGIFLPQLGAFENSKLKDAVQFHAVESLVAQQLPRKLGGGRFPLLTEGLLDDRNQLIRLREGDQIEFYIEVFNRNPDQQLAVSGRSETRTRPVVTLTEFAAWWDQTIQEYDRVRTLAARQAELFQPK